jgi:hypothetical protein
VAVLSPAQLVQFAPLLRGIVAQLDQEGLVTGLACGTRSPDDQARIMAGLEGETPGWIKGTYRDSHTLELVLAAIDGLTAPKDAAAIETAILGAFAAGNPREVSAHLPNASGMGEAVDLEPVGEGPLAVRARELVAEAIAAGAHPHSEVLTNEHGHAVCHVQAWTA